MKSGTSDVMLAFNESYRIMLGKSIKNWPIFGDSVIWIAKPLMYNKAMLLVVCEFLFVFVLFICFSFPIASLESAGFVSSFSSTNIAINGLQEQPQCINDIYE